jgi:hypothetical protein
MAEPAWKDRVTTYYAALLERLRREQPTSALLLEILGLYKYRSCSREKMSPVLCGVVGTKDPGLCIPLFDEAAFRLQTLSLITLGQDSNIEMNRLTMTIVRALLGTRDVELLDTLYGLVDRGLRDCSLQNDADGFDRWKDIWYGFAPQRTLADIRTAEESPWDTFPDYRSPRQQRPVVGAHVIEEPTYDSTLYTLHAFGRNIERLFAELEAINLAVAESLSGQ